MLRTGMNFSTFGFTLSDADVMRLMKEAGFDTFFTGTMAEADTLRFRELGEKAGLRYESIHAPFRGINCMWDEGEKGDAYVAELCKVADLCRKAEIPYFTLHCMNVPQFNVDVTKPIKWSELGLERFRRVVEYAEECGVIASFENVEFPHFELKGLLEELRKGGYKSLGFTWDVGHEHCYPAVGFEVADAFGDLMVGTHVHDNFGQSDPHVITWNDDSHIPPFDGTLDYRKVGASLKKCGYTGTVTLELSKRGIAPIPWYRDITPEELYPLLHERAERIALWCENAE